MIDLPSQSTTFAQEINDLLGNVLSGEAPAVASTQLQGVEGRYVIQPPVPDGAEKPARIPLYVAGEHLANLHLSLQLCPDHRSLYLKVARSECVVYSVLDRNPLLRLEYRADMRSKPCSHWQIHAERGAFSHLLTHGQRTAGVQAPHDLSSLHLPTGGERFRPCLEDLLQFLIVDCGIDAKQGWETHLVEGREKWRRRQLGASIRDAPGEAVRVLKQMGYTIMEPDPAPEDKLENLRRW